MPDTTASENQAGHRTEHHAGHRDVPVEFCNVSFSIGKNKLIHNASCKLDQAGKTVVMGPNGAGKSLFLRLVAGLLKPDSGKVVIWGDKLGSSRQTGISMVFQNPVLLARSAYENVAYVLQQQGHPRQVIKQKVNEALALAQLQRQAQTPARQMSGGEQQRLALARALVVEPNILLLDEATANLDPASTFIVEKMIDDVSRSGKKVVFITHDVRQAKRVGDNILFIHGGHILANKPAKDFFRDPGSHEAQAYLDGRVANKS